MKKLPIYNKLEEITSHLLTYKAQKKYLGMYSSIFSGITTNPQMMTLPIDDHLVHRGDGVFEAFKMIDGKIFLCEAHLNRLVSSAKTIALELRHTKDEIKGICKQLVEATKVKNALFRLYASRGPGNFSPNPYDPIGPQLYIILNSLTQPLESLYENGVKIGFSEVPIKTGWMAQTKSCNYLPNVMMKKEAVDKALDYMITVTPEGNLGEGATENIAYLTSEKDIIFSSFDHTLKGTTLLRLQELSCQLIKQGLIREMKEDKQQAQELMKASEIMLIGTTIDVLPVVEVEGQKVGSGSPGPVAKAAREILRADQLTGGASLSVI